MHHKRVVFLLLMLMGAFGFAPAQSRIKNANADTVLKVQMYLSAFGVESDVFPSIEAVIDLQADSAKCTKSYYNPAYKSSVYYLSKTAIRQIDSLLNKSDLSKLKTSYTTKSSDQPTSTTTIYTKHATYIISDYGLQAEEPLKQLYQLVYRLQYDE